MRLLIFINIYVNDLHRSFYIRKIIFDFSQKPMQKSKLKIGQTII